MPDVKVLEQRCVDLTIAGCALSAVVRGAEGKRSCAAVSTNAVVYTSREAGLRRGVGAPPVIEGTMANNHGAVLISAAEPESIRVAVAGAEDGNWKSGIEDGGSCEFPASEHSIEETVRIPAKRSAVSEGKFIDTDEVQAMADIHRRWTVVGFDIVAVLVGGPVEACVGDSIVAGRVGQGFRIGVIQRVFQSVMSSLAQRQLTRVVRHARFGLGNQDWIAPDQSEIGRLVSRWNIRSPASPLNIGDILRLLEGQLVAVAIIREVMPNLAVIPGAQRQFIR